MALVLAATAGCNHARQGAVLSGTVTDSAKQPVPAAIVTVINRSTNVSVGAVANRTGAYLTPSLPPGKYVIVVQKEGFQPALRPNIQIHARENLQIDVQLAERGASKVLNDVHNGPALN